MQRVFSFCLNGNELFAGPQEAAAEAVTTRGFQINKLTNK